MAQSYEIKLIWCAIVPVISGNAGEHVRTMREKAEIVCNLLHL